MAQNGAPAPVRYDAIPSDSPSWTFTVDDGGVTSATEIAPVLDRLGWPGHFFVTSGRVGTPGFVSEGQVRELHAAGHVIGTHTASHPSRASKIPYRELVEEWRESSRRLSDILGEQVVVASVPGGYYTRNVARAAAEAGLEVLFNSEPIRSRRTVEGVLVLGRYCIKQGTSDREVVNLVTGGSWYGLKHWLHWNAKKVAKAVAGPFYFPVRKSLIDRSG
jgi:peptidoglycan/xylan/chitin deacetylase (PgdA/CDA1 family)